MWSRNLKYMLGSVQTVIIFASDTINQGDKNYPIPQVGSKVYKKMSHH